MDAGGDMEEKLVRAAVKALQLFIEGMVWEVLLLGK